MVKILTDANFEKEINGSDKMVLVDFFATWCEPCSLLSPILEKISEHFKGKVDVMKVDVSNAPIASQKYNVDRIPAVFLFKNGKQIDGFTGLIPENAIKNWLENILTNNKNEQ